MKMFGLFVTIALVIPLAACERRDQCDSGGWCEGTQVYACYRDRDCPPNNYCDQHGVCQTLGPIPPGRGAGGTGGTGTGGFPGVGMTAASISARTPVSAGRPEPAATPRATPA